MKDEIVKFETAKLAKEVNFNLNLNSGYTSEGIYTSFGKEKNYNVFREILYNNSNFPYITSSSFPNAILTYVCTAPTQSLLQRWLREKHNIHIYVEPYWDSQEHAMKADTIPEYVGWWIAEYIENAEPPVYYTTYEEALEVTLFEALTWLKEKLNER